MGGWFIGFGLDCPSKTDSVINICSILCSPFLYAFSCIVGLAYLVSNGCRKRGVSNDLTEIIVLDSASAKRKLEVENEDHDSISSPEELLDYQDDQRVPMLPYASPGGKKGMPIDRKQAWDTVSSLMDRDLPAIDGEKEGKEAEEVHATQVVIHEPSKELPVRSTPKPLDDIEEEERMSEDEDTAIFESRKQFLDHNENEEIIRSEEEEEILQKKIARKLAWEAMNEFIRRGSEQMQEPEQQNDLVNKSEDEVQELEDIAPSVSPEEVEYQRQESTDNDDDEEKEGCDENEPNDLRKTEEEEKEKDEKEEEDLAEEVEECEQLQPDVEIADVQDPKEECDGEQKEEQLSEPQSNVKQEANEGERECRQPDQGSNDDREDEEEEEDWCQIIRGPIEDRFDEMNVEEDGDEVEEKGAREQDNDEEMESKDLDVQQGDLETDVACPFDNLEAVEPVTSMDTDEDGSEEHEVLKEVDQEKNYVDIEPAADEAIEEEVNQNVYDVQLLSPPLCKSPDKEEEIPAYEPDDEDVIGCPANREDGRSLSPSPPPWPDADVCAQDEEEDGAQEPIIADANESSLLQIMQYLNLKETFNTRRTSKAWKKMAEKRLSEWIMLSSGEVDTCCPFGCVVSDIDKCFQIRDPHVLNIVAKYCTNLKSLWTRTSIHGEDSDAVIHSIMEKISQSIECLVMPDLKFNPSLPMHQLKHLECSSISDNSLEGFKMHCPALESLSVRSHCTTFPDNLEHLKCWMRSTSLGHFLSNDRRMRSLVSFDASISHPQQYLTCPYFKPFMDSLEYPNLKTLKITCPVIRADAMNVISALLLEASNITDFEIRGRVEDNELLDWLYQSIARITKIKFRINVKDDFRKLVKSTPDMQQADLRIQMLTPMLMHDVSGWKQLQELSLTRTMDAYLLPREFPIHDFIRGVFDLLPTLVKLRILNQQQTLSQEENDQLLKVGMEKNLRISLVNGSGKARSLAPSHDHNLFYHIIIVVKRA